MNSPQDTPQFEELSKLDKPNVDWVTTLALNDTRIILMNAYIDDNAKKMFLGAIESLLINTLYYWFLDPGFKQEIATIDMETKIQLSTIPPDMDHDPNTGTRRLDIHFQAARKKYYEIIMAITKNTKNVPYVDTA